MVLWPVGISGQLAEELFATDASIAMANNSATKEETCRGSCVRQVLQIGLGIQLFLARIMHDRDESASFTAFLKG